MRALFEYTDKLNRPYECFYWDASKEWVPVRPHWHYFMEILYVTQGTALVCQNEESYIAGEGDLILFLPSVVHAVYMASDIPLQYYVVKFDLGQLDSSGTGFGGSWNYSALFKNAVHSKHADICFSQETIKDIPVLSLLCDCVREMEEMQYGYQMMLQSKIRELLTWLLRLFHAALAGKHNLHHHGIYRPPCLRAYTHRGHCRALPHELFLLCQKFPSDLRSVLQKIYRIYPALQGGGYAAVYQFRLKLHQPGNRVFRLQPSHPRL